MITSSGVICDICGKYILLEDYQPFWIKGIERQLQCHTGVCKAQLEDAADDWTKLPGGPLRDAFAEVNNET